jgi:hypothetical protein
LADIAPYKIRTRQRHLASPPPGMRQSWTEVQVVLGRRVVHRCDIEAEAKAWTSKQQATA